MKTVEVKCKNCVFNALVPVPQKQNEMVSVCMFNPPSVFPLGSPQGIQIIPMRPIVHGDEWCGQWEGKEALIKNPN